MTRNRQASPPLNGFGKKKKKVLEWPSQNLDLNVIELLWLDIKQAVHAGKPSSVTELKQFCKLEW